MSTKNERGKRGNKDFALISGYIPKDMARQFRINCAVQEVTQSDILEKMIGEWLEATAPVMPVSPDIPPGTQTIAQLVSANLSKLKSAGIKNLTAIADDEVLPTAYDFARIASTLGLTKAEQKAIWNKTFNSGNVDRHEGIQNGSQSDSESTRMGLQTDT